MTKTNIPSCAAVGFVAGKLFICGIKIPSLLFGAVILDDLTSNFALGVVVPIPTWAYEDIEIKNNSASNFVFIKNAIF